MRLIARRPTRVPPKRFTRFASQQVPITSTTVGSYSENSWKQSYPLQDIEVIERDQGGIDLVATLLGTAANPRELDEIIPYLDGSPLVENAS